MQLAEQTYHVRGHWIPIWRKDGLVCSGHMYQSDVYIYMWKAMVNAINCIYLQITEDSTQVREGIIHYAKQYCNLVTGVIQLLCYAVTSNIMKETQIDNISIVQLWS